MNNTIKLPDGSILTKVPESTLPKLNPKDIEITTMYGAMKIQEQIINNLKMDLSSFPEKENTVYGKLEETIRHLESQTKELEHIRYENKKLNAQLQTANMLFEEQSEKLNNLQDANSELRKANKTLKDANKHSFRNGFLAALIPAVIILIATVILTHCGLL